MALHNLDWENICPGTAYVVTSRARTIGVATKDNPYPSQSNLFYIGQIGPTRFTRVAYKKDGEMCLMVWQRDAWCKYLQEKSDETADRLDAITIEIMKAFVMRELYDSIRDINNNNRKRIVDILIAPNNVWKERRKNYLIV